MSTFLSTNANFNDGNAFLNDGNSYLNPGKAHLNHGNKQHEFKKVEVYKEVDTEFLAPGKAKQTETVEFLSKKEFL